MTPRDAYRQGMGGGHQHMPPPPQQPMPPQPTMAYAPGGVTSFQVHTDPTGKQARFLPLIGDYSMRSRKG